MKDTKQKWKWIAGISVIILCGIFSLFQYEKPQEKKDSGQMMFDSPEPVKTEEKAKEIYVHICGEVKRPGVYSFSGETRLVQVIEAAGGFTKKAATESVNQAQPVTDGMQVIIEGKKSLKKKDSRKPEEEKGLVNINTASETELMTLSGIGQAKAMQIVNYRNEHGNFQKKEDIMKISGIKEGIFHKIKDSITV